MRLLCSMICRCHRHAADEISGHTAATLPLLALCLYCMSSPSSHPQSTQSQPRCTAFAGQRHGCAAAVPLLLTLLPDSLALTYWHVAAEHCAQSFQRDPLLQQPIQLLGIAAWCLQQALKLSAQHWRRGWQWQLRLLLRLAACCCTWDRPQRQQRCSYLSRGSQGANRSP